MQSIALIDYGSGNLRSAEKALQRARRERGDSVVTTTDDPEIIARADRIVLPGVGAFAACMTAVEHRPGVVEAMTEAVKSRGAPFLGVCVGMQLLATKGLEFGETGGLDWIPGEVRRLTPDGAHYKVPHMGWNALDIGVGHPCSPACRPARTCISPTPSPCIRRARRIRSPPPTTADGSPRPWRGAISPGCSSTPRSPRLRA